MDYNPDHEESGAVVSDYVAQSNSNNNIVYHYGGSGRSHATIIYLFLALPSDSELSLEVKFHLVS